MPKKTRKMKQRAAMRRSAAVAPVRENGEEVASVPAGDTTAQLRPSLLGARPATPLTFDYSHIYGDLRRIALFAGFFFVVLIALSFIIK